jgi:hypothetical protein
MADGGRGVGGVTVYLICFTLSKISEIAFVRGTSTLRSRPEAYRICDPDILSPDPKMTFSPHLLVPVLLLTLFLRLYDPLLAYSINLFFL